MKPKERMLSALNFSEPDDLVPSWEIEFHLFQQLLGKMPVLGEMFDKLTKDEKEKATCENAEIFIEAAKQLDFSAISIPPGY
jgi:hypothetical protein